jgi:hypothetical protein
MATLVHGTLTLTTEVKKRVPGGQKISAQDQAEQPKEGLAGTDNQTSSTSTPTGPLLQLAGKLQEGKLQEMKTSKTAQRTTIATFSNKTPRPLLRSISATRQAQGAKAHGSSATELPKPANHRLANGEGQIKIFEEGQLETVKAAPDGRCFFNAIALALGSEQARLGKDFPKALEPFVVKLEDQHEQKKSVELQKKAAQGFFDQIGRIVHDRYGLDLSSTTKTTITEKDLEETILKHTPTATIEEKNQKIISAATTLAELAKGLNLGIAQTPTDQQEPLKQLTEEARNRQAAEAEAKAQAEADGNSYFPSGLVAQIDKIKKILVEAKGNQDGAHQAIWLDEKDELVKQMTAIINNEHFQARLKKVIRESVWTGFAMPTSLTAQHVFAEKGIEDSEPSGFQYIMKEFFNIDITIVNQAISESDDKSFIMQEPVTTSNNVHVFVKYNGKFYQSGENLERTHFEGTHFDALVPKPSK